MDLTDRILSNGSGVSEGKLRIYEQFSLGQSNQENAAFLKAEYGIGGSYPALSINGIDYSESHDAKGILIREGMDGPSVRVTWDAAAKRIGTMIAENRYLNASELAVYPAYLRKKAEQLERRKVSDAFRELLADYAGDHADVNRYVLLDCASAFAEGRKTTWTLTRENWILPLMRTALDGIAANGTADQKNRANALLETLEAPLAQLLMPTAEELHPAVPEYSVSVSAGDSVWVNGRERRIASFTDGEKVSLADEDFPLFTEDLLWDNFRQELLSDARNAAFLVRKQEPEILSVPEPGKSKTQEYHVGDTLILDGSRYTVEHVGMFDISMQTEGQQYPISRVESRENLERLLVLPENEHIHNPEISLSSPVPKDYRMGAIPPANGPKEQFRRNMAAIALLHTLRSESRPATPEEQDILARYAGWGGLSAAFDRQNPSWTKEYAELEAALSPAEYLSARASTLSAHYTSAEIIREMYGILERMGFIGGNILEPAAGIGNFLGSVPQNWNGNFHAVELDNLSGEILKKLYPGAEVTIAGFETTKGSNIYDLAIGNVPFGQIKVNDPQLNRYNFSIHNYFFAKAISLVRPGGLIAFITSRYTMDAKSSAARRYIAERAELLGAIRLPETAFSSAGTEAVADILFLQKRPAPIKTEPEWLTTEETADGLLVNSYFLRHPEMILGSMEPVSGPHGMTLTVKENPEVSLGERIRRAGQSITGTYLPSDVVPQITAEKKEALPGDPELRPWSYALRNGSVYFQEDGDLVLQNLGKTALERIKAMIPLRDTLRQLIAMQTDAAASEEDLQGLRNRLNDLYDRFAEKYGRMNTPVNSRCFSQDCAWPLLGALEKMDGDGKVYEKADIFYRRTVRPYLPITHADTAADALALSLGERGRVDLAYMASLTGKAEAELEKELAGVIYRDVQCTVEDPKKIPFQLANLSAYPPVTADEYLSGNIREKLRMAGRLLPALPPEQQTRLRQAMDALTQAKPRDLDAAEISVRLGATWIPAEDIGDFIRSVLKPPAYAFYALRVEYFRQTGEWNISGVDSYTRSTVNATATYGISRMDAYELLERTLNRGFQLNLERNSFDLLLVLQGSGRHFVTPGKNAKGNFLRMDHILEAIPDRIQAAKNRLEALHLQILDAKAELEKPFPQEELLKEKSQRLVELNAQLDMNAGKSKPDAPTRQPKTGPDLQ